MRQFLRPVLSWSSLWLMLSIPIFLAACSGSANAVDREPLVAIFNVADGPNWSDNSIWLSGRSLDLWYGVVTASDGSGRVIDVSLGANQLSPNPPMRGVKARQVGMRELQGRWRGLHGDDVTRQRVFSSRAGL